MHFNPSSVHLLYMAPNLQGFIRVHVDNLRCLHGAPTSEYELKQK
jgi:hypothetical protein